MAIQIEQENDDNQEYGMLDFFMMLTGFLLIMMQLMQLKPTQQDSYLDYDLVSLPEQSVLFQVDMQTKDFEVYDRQSQRWHKQKPPTVDSMRCLDQQACLAFFGENIAIKPGYQVSLGLPQYVSSMVNQTFVEHCAGGQKHCRITAKIFKDTVKFDMR